MKTEYQISETPDYVLVTASGNTKGQFKLIRECFREVTRFCQEKHQRHVLFDVSQLNRDLDLTELGELAEQSQDDLSHQLKIAVSWGRPAPSSFFLFNMKEAGYHIQYFNQLNEAENWLLNR